MCNASITMPETASKDTQFDEWFVAALNSAALMFMISIGHRTQLFDVMAELDWTDSHELADKAGLNERYVREWLGALATGGIIQTDASNKYWFSPEKAQFLTRTAGADNLAIFAQYMSVLGSVEDEILECFYNGGGVPYEKFQRFHELMADESGITVVGFLEDQILPLIPDIKQKLSDGIKVLDVGCGRGKALMKMAVLYPNSRFHGLDLSEEAIVWARNEAKARNLDNVDFEIRDASDFDVTAEPNAYDFVTTFDAVHDQAKPLAVLKGIYRTLKSGGVYLMQDIHSHGIAYSNMQHPLGPLLYTISCMHCMTVSLAQGGDGLGAMWGREKAHELLAEAGFKDVKIHQLEHDEQNDYYVIRKK